MNKFLGLHFGIRAATAVSITRAGDIYKAAELRHDTEDKFLFYSQQQITAIIEWLNSHFSASKHTLIISIPAAAVYYRNFKGFQPETLKINALKYAAEPTLPIRIEQLHFSSIYRRSNQAAILAIPLRPWENLFREFDRNKWVCPIVIPDALALSKLLPKQKFHNLRIFCSYDPVEGAIILSKAEQIIWIRPLCALSNTEDKSFLHREIAKTVWSCSLSNEESAVELVTLNDHESKPLNEIEDINLKTYRLPDLIQQTTLQSWGALYAYAAAKILQKPQLPVPNLRTQKLRSSLISKRNRNILQIHFTGAAIVLIALIVGLWTQIFRLSERAQYYHHTSTKIWSSIFPTRLPPPDVLITLKSELAREQGLRRRHAGVPHHSSALNFLRDLVRLFPSGIPVRIQRIDVSGNLSVITGLARTHAEVEQIANSLAKIERLEVLPPTTEKTDRFFVRFNIRIEQKERNDDKDCETSSDREEKLHANENNTDYAANSNPDLHAIQLRKKQERTNKFTKTGSTMFFCRRFHIKAQEPAETRTRTASRFSCYCRLPRKCGKKCGNEQRPDSFYTTTVSSTSPSNSVRQNRHQSKTYRGYHEKCGTSYSASQKTVAGSYNHKTVFLDRF